MFSEKATTATQQCMFLRIFSLITIKSGGIVNEFSLYSRTFLKSFKKFVLRGSSSNKWYLEEDGFASIEACFTGTST